MPPPEPPAAVVAAATERAAARAGGDFARADALRDRIAVAGWMIRDTPSGWSLAPAPPYAVLPSVRDLPDRSGVPADRRATVSVLVEGWPQDVRSCLTALIAHAPAGVVVTALDLGNVAGAGDTLHEVAAAHPGRVEELHVARPAGWSEARVALLRCDTAAVHVWLDPSTVLAGDALSPVLAAFDDPTVVAAGWRGVNVDLAADWRQFVPAGPGEVDALLGYLLAFRRAAGLAVGGPHPKARFYRNADVEFSLLLREAGLGRLVVPDGELPIRQDRHRGYSDTEPALRERESRRTYERILTRFRGRTDLLAPR